MFPSHDRLADYSHPVIWTPFREGVFLLEKFITQKGYEPIKFMGGVSPEELEKRSNLFNNGNNGKRVAIGTIKFAQSFELWSSKECYFTGYEYTQDDNYQAERRLIRLITPHPVSSYYIRYIDSVEEDIMQVLNNNVRVIKQSTKGFTNAIRKKVLES